MPGIGIVTRTINEHQLIISHADIVELMNEARGVNGMPGVSSLQVILLGLERENGSKVGKGELKPGESLIFSITAVEDYADVATYTGGMDLKPPIVT